ncbi:MAG: LacI family transcriptional regulator [Opitutaceae bacterium]|jgi:DNA-binding LacI/PurR family transcriptional regulator|nr:LacI family transcriptional regulator [Opitutaceae bacterium]
MSTVREKLALPSQSKASLADVAGRCGVSISTVSRVVNGSADVSPELLDKVQAAIAEIGYKPTRVRRVAEAGGMVGFLSDNSSHQMTADEFQHRFLIGAESALNSRKQHLMFASCKDDIVLGKLPLMVEENLVRGLVVKGGGLATGSLQWLLRLQKRVPLVTLMQHSPGREFCSVMCDNEGGVHRALTYLRDLGHTRIGFFNIQDTRIPRSQHHHERMNAFIAHAPQLDVPLHPGSVQALYVDCGVEPMEVSVRRALKAWADMGDTRPTAVICATDIYGITLISEAQKQGIRVPQDLGVIGFMNQVACERSMPPMTSLSLCGEEMGQAAIELLGWRIANPAAPVRHLVIATKLVERLSCAAVTT